MSGSSLAAKTVRGPNLQNEEVIQKISKGQAWYAEKRSDDGEESHDKVKVSDVKFVRKANLTAADEDGDGEPDYEYFYYYYYDYLDPSEVGENALETLPTPSYLVNNSTQTASTAKPKIWKKALKKVRKSDESEEDEDGEVIETLPVPLPIKDGVM